MYLRTRVIPTFPSSEDLLMSHIVSCFIQCFSQTSHFTSETLETFKTKVITKLFSQADGLDDSDDLSNDDCEENMKATTRSSPSLSDNDHESQVHDTIIYGIHRCPTEIKQENYIKNSDCNLASVSPASNDEDYESDIVKRKRKRRRHGHSESRKLEHPDSTSSGSNNTNDPSPMTLSSLTKNQKRKLKKKRKEKEKRADNSVSTEFTYDTSGPTREKSQVSITTSIKPV